MDLELRLRGKPTCDYNMGMTSSEFKKGARVRVTKDTPVLFDVLWSHRLMVRKARSERTVEAGRTGTVLTTRPGATIIHWDDDTGSGVANTALEAI